VVISEESWQIVFLLEIKCCKARPEPPTVLVLADLLDWRLEKQ
jgi:hypothetical protein